MFKRIILGIISAVMAATLLCGCSFFTHNTERDYKQVVATVASYDIVNEVVEKVNGENTTVTKTYSTKAKTIYKLDLVEYLNANGESLSQTYKDMKSLVGHAMEMLVDTELITNEVDALIDAGLIKWGQKEKNDVKKQIYTVIDSTLITLQNDILEERDKPTIDNSTETVDTETTYPIKPEEEVDDDEDVKDEQPWEPSLVSYPGLTGDTETRSLGREAMRRFISLIKSRVEDDFRITSEQRKQFDEDIKNIDDVINTQGIEYVYPMIGDTAIVYYVSGEDIERSFKIRALQEYLTDSVTVRDEDVAKSFSAKLNDQRSSFAADPASYDTAMSGSDPVLYHLNGDYFYVKHILLPFSDEQKADLEAFKGKLNVTKEQIKEYRANLVNGIVCYPHVSGEDDKSHPMTVNEVMGEIRAKMKPLENNVKSADLAFDDLIYLYNTDPGAFGNNKGYLVKDADTGNNYMEEFTDGARYMRANLAVGQVYYEPVVTDYGVHIMYFASTTKVGEVGLYDYTTPGEVETYYDLIADPIRTTSEGAVYTSWEANILNYNYKTRTTLYESRYEDLWED